MFSVESQPVRRLPMPQVFRPAPVQRLATTRLPSVNDSGATPLEQPAAPQVPRPARRPSPRRRWLGPAIVVGGLVVAAVFLRGAVPDPADVWHALTVAARSWLAVATVAQLVSLVMFAQQQRGLLAAFGGSMSMRHAVGLTFARTAISISVPAGAAVSVGFAIRQFRLRGATASAAAAMILLAGIQSLAALLLLYVGWLATVGLAAADGSGYAVATAAALIVVGVLLLGWRRPQQRVARARTGETHALPGPAATRWQWITTVRDLAADAIRHAASLSRRDWTLGGGAAMGNWLFDVACLLAVGRAFGLPVNAVKIVGAYLVVQLIRQIPLTPGGVGLVEASLLLSLVAAGATSGTAAAVVLTYRLLSCWLIAPIGLLSWFTLRANPDRPPAHRPRSYARSDHHA